MSYDQKLDSLVCFIYLFIFILFYFYFIYFIDDKSSVEESSSTEASLFQVFNISHQFFFRFRYQFFRLLVIFLFILLDKIKGKIHETKLVIIIHHKKENKNKNKK